MSADICSSEKTLLEDFKFCQGKKSLPGTKKRVYLADVRDIVGYPTAPNRAAEGFSLKDVPVFTGAFTMAQGKFFATVDIVPNKGKITVETQGSYGSKTFKNTYSGKAPGTEEELTGLIAELINADVIAVVPTRTGKFRIIGSEDFPAAVNPGQDTGEGVADANETSLEITSDDELPAPFFTGTLPTSEGSLNCATGTVTAG